MTVRIHPAFDGVIVPAATLLMAVVGLVLALVCSNLAIPNPESRIPSPEVRWCPGTEMAHDN